MIKYKNMKVSWRSYPLIDFPVKSLFLFVILVIIGYFVYQIFEAGIYLILYILFFIVSFLGYFFPTFYEIDDEGITIKRFKKFFKKWSEFKKVYVDKNGFFLSPFEEKNMLMKTRGIYVMCYNSKCDEIVKFIKEKVENVKK